MPNPVVPTPPPIRLPDRSVNQPTINQRSIGKMQLKQELRDLLVGADRTFLANDQTVNNSTTLVDITGFAVTVVNGQNLFIKAILAVDSSTVADVKVDLSAPTGSVGYFSIWADQGAGSAVIGTSFTTSTTIARAGLGAGTVNLLHCEAFVDCAAAGTVKLQFAQNTAEVSNTTIKAGSFFEVVTD